MFDLAYFSKNAYLLRKSAFDRNSIIFSKYIVLTKVARYNRYIIIRVLIKKNLDLKIVFMKDKESCRRSNDYFTSKE